MPARKSIRSSTGTKGSAYVETSALIAFADRSDTYHPLFRRLFSDPPVLVTTTLVISEGHGWFLRRYDSSQGLQFLSMIESMPLEIVSTGSQEIRDASLLLRRFSDQELTVTDAAGLCLMAARRIRRCWSTNFHLGLTGVPLVIHG